MSTDKPYIVCSAIKNPNNEEDLICGARHHHCFTYFRIRFKNGDEDVDDWEQGFIDQFGSFYNREDAHRMMRITGQKPGKIIGGVLTSEDLY